MMVKWKPWCWSLHNYHNNNNNYYINLFLKLGVLILLAFLAFTLVILFSPSNYNEFSKTHLLDNTVNPINPPPENRDHQIPHKEKCDIFSGDWVQNLNGPAYKSESCQWIESPQNCMKNGRPDTAYLYWRWFPRDCELPQFNSNTFLQFMTNKTLALIGDSLSRNHAQSLLCLLSKVEQAVEIYHDNEFKSKTWYFSSFNFTLSLIWSPFLVKSAIFEDDSGVSTSEAKLHLDKLDSNWTDHFYTFHYIIFSSGTWFGKPTIYYENDTILGCHYCHGKNITEFYLNFSYHKVLKNLFNFITMSNHKGTIFYRTTSPDHFEGGNWYNGGSCPRTEPVKEGELEVNEENKNFHDIEVEEFENVAANVSERGVDFRLLDVAPLSLLRPDGHPGPYWHFHPFEKGKNGKKILIACIGVCPGQLIRGMIW